MSTPQYEVGAWSLQDLFPAANSPEVEASRQLVENTLQELEGLREQLNPQLDSETFLYMLSLTEKISVEVMRQYGYAQLWYAENTQNEQALAFVGKMEELSTDIGNRSLFLQLWWKGLDETNAQRLLAESRQYRYYLEAQRLTRDFILPEREEQLLNIKNSNGSQALVKIYDMLTNAYKFKLEIDGETQLLTRDELMDHVYSANPERRAAAYQELLRVFGEDGMSLAQIYIHLARDWHQEFIKLRNYPSPITVRNLANDIPDAVVDTMLSVCRKNASVFQRWFRIKAKMVGMEKLRRYDIYAPLGEINRRYSYDEAVKLVLDCVNDFSPEVRTKAEAVFSSGHVHSAIKQGKMGGAFCYGVLPTLLPWMLVNFNGSLNAVATLAHELGHGIHDIYAGEQNSALTHQPSLPLAETASTFAEMLVTDRLLADATPEERRNILGTKLDDLYATIQRQAFFAIWEQTAHRMIQEGASTGQLTNAYLENLREQFGDAIDVSEDFKWESIAIPHFYFLPFYVYAYSFGQLLVLALYQRYKQQGAEFVPAYLKILAHGGNASPSQILAEAGVDMADASFWQGGYDFINSLLDELESIPSA